MKKILLFIILLIFVSILWYASLIFFAENINNVLAPTTAAITINHSIFLALFLAAVCFAIILLSLQVNTNKIKLDNTIHATNIHLEIIALSSLIDECDSTLHRYDRWEEAGIKGDYMNAKTSVRDKMNLYREKLHNRYEDIQLLKSETSV